MRSFAAWERVLEVLQREVLEMILAEDPDAVDEALEHVLEHAALATDLDEHLEAVERPLALADALEVVGRLFQEAHRGDVRLAGLPDVAALLRAAREVEVNERAVVRIGAAAHTWARRDQSARAPRQSSAFSR